MSDEKLSHQELMQEELVKQELHPEKVKYPPKMAYKKDRSSRNGIEEGSQIGFKSVVVLSVDAGREVAGYLLAEVLDWDEADGTTFDDRTTFIVRVLEASSPRVAKHVGHLRCASFARYWFGRNLKVVNLGRGIWSAYCVSPSPAEGV